MTSLSNTEIRKQLIKNLESGDNKIVSDTISKLREKGKLTDIKIIFNLLLKNDNIKIISDCIELISDIKEKSAGQEIISCLEDAKYASIKKIIVEICWNTNIDMSEHLHVFVNLLIHEEFSIAFEAFTVIENMAADIDSSIKEEQIILLKDAISVSDETKKTFIHEAIHLINNIKS